MTPKLEQLEAAINDFHRAAELGGKCYDTANEIAASVAGLAERIARDLPIGQGALPPELRLLAAYACLMRCDAIVSEVLREVHGPNWHNSALHNLQQLKKPEQWLYAMREIQARRDNKEP